MTRKSPGYWEANFLEEARKYHSVTEFQAKARGAYKAAYRLGRINELHALYGSKPKVGNDYWTFERCVKEAVKYRHIVDFKRGCRSAYEAVIRNDWQEKAFRHMNPKGNHERRYIYEIADHFRRVIYIGLTCDPVSRLNAHVRTNAKIRGNFHSPKLIKLTGLVSATDAQSLEQFFVDHYRDKGYRVLNEIKPGGLGFSVVKWTKQKCALVASSCANWKTFRENHASAYYRCIRMGWVSDILCMFPHLISARQRHVTSLRNGSACPRESRNDRSDRQA